MDSSTKIKLYRIDAGHGEWVDDSVAVEETLTLTVNGRELVALLYTPPMAVELALGYLQNEGLIKDMDDVLSATGTPDGVDVVLRADIPAVSGATRVLTSGCGGGITFTYPKGLMQVRVVVSELKISCDDITSLANRFRQASPLFEETGGVHSAALSDGGEVLSFAEDIGRHNAVDKVFGACLMKGIDTRDRVMMSTGRVSSEILLKCVKRGVPVIVSRGAPTSLAVTLAERFGMTLVGFARGRRMNVYTGVERVVL